jgi:uncharacterized protein (TIGR02001 family)
MNLKRMMAGTAVAAGMLASPSAFAGMTGNVGAFSEYMFRGIAQTGGAAVQGGLDYSHDSGLYLGTWGSNIGFGGGTEVDLYGGYATKIGEIGLDIGGIYYWYSEEDEVDAELDTAEFYVGASFGPVAVKYYYSDEANFFIGDGEAEEAGYLLGTLALPITDSLNFTANIGMYDGDEIERFLGDEDSYIDYSVGLAKSLDGGFTVTFQYIATDIEGELDPDELVDGDEIEIDDEPKFVVGVKKTFDL